MTVSLPSCLLPKYGYSVFKSLTHLAADYLTMQIEYKLIRANKETPK